MVIVCLSGLHCIKNIASNMTVSGTHSRGSVCSITGVDVHIAYRLSNLSVHTALDPLCGALVSLHIARGYAEYCSSLGSYV